MANSLTKPSVLANTFCNSGDKRSIPTSATGTNGASLIEGFPAITSTPIAQGGIPPERLDFNGVLNLLSQYCYFLQNGGTFFYDANVASAIGGYPQGAILNYTDTYGNIIQIKSLVNNNTDEPSSSNIKTPINSGATKWEIVSNKMTELFLINPNATTQNPVYNGYVRITLNNSGYFRLGNVKGLYFGDQSVGIDVTPNSMNINTTTFTVSGNPIVRTPDYSNRTKLADSDQETTLTIANDGWLMLRTKAFNAYVTIGGHGIINQNDSVNGALVSMMIPIKAGDVVSTRNTVVYFYPYR